MITRAHMRRQLRATGGITNARQGYGIGSWVKEKVRKLIPNELANIAAKAAPFVAPFYPGAAAAMRGIGRFDKRGSISDAMKQAALTYAGGKGVRYLGGAEGATGGLDSYSMKGFREGPVGRTWDRIMPERQAKDITLTGKESTYGAKDDLFLGDKVIPGVDIPKATGDFSLKGIWNKFQSLPAGARTAIVGVGSGAIAGIAQWFQNQVPQEPGESMEEYMVRRKATVGKLMRTYMDNYYKHDATYSALDDAGKDAFVAKYNMNKGGRVGYNEGVKKMNQDGLEFIVPVGQSQELAFYNAIVNDVDGVMSEERKSEWLNLLVPQLIESGEMSREEKDELGLNQGGRVGYQTGGISMANTLAQNRAINNAQRASNQLTMADARRRAQQNISSAMRSGGKEGLGSFLQSQYNQVANPNQVMGFTSYDSPLTGIHNFAREQLTDSLAQQYMGQQGGNTTYTPAPKPRPITYRNVSPEAQALNMSQATYEDITSSGADPRQYYMDYQNRMLTEAGNPNLMTYEQVMGGPMSGIGPGMFTTRANQMAQTEKYENMTQAERDVFHQQEKDKMNQMMQTNPGGYADFNKAVSYYGTNPYGVTQEEIKDMVEGRDTGYMGAQDYLDQFVLGLSGQGIAEKYGIEYNQGGRVGYAIGSPEKQLEAGAPPIIYEGNMDPRAQNQQAGLPSIPGPMQMAEDGPEFDMRQRGGFQPLGRQEGKDDVPAMLAKNEFVMTADAVRAAGGGSIQKGAQRMYDTMKKLERRVS